MSPAARSAPEPAGPPAVSVVIPCYRQADLLPEAVASVALQTFRDWEIVVVDDGSPDDTSAVARDLARKLPGRRIRVKRQPNRGLSGARNTGVRLARGRWVLPLDADDLLEATFLEKTVAALERNPSAAIAFTDVQRFGAEDALWRMGPFTAEALSQRNVACCTALYRREVWEAVGGYDETLRRGYEDWSFWISAVERGCTAVHVPEPLFLYRARAGSMIERTAEQAGLVTAEVVARHPRFFPAEAVGKARALLSASGEPVPAPEPAPARAEAAAPPPAPAAAEPRRAAIVAGDRPELTLVFASYDHERWLAQAIASLASQTVAYDRVVFFSDGSRDRTLEIARERLAGIPNVVFLDALDRNRGLTARLREAEARIPAGYVQTLSGDDLLHPRACETFRRLIEREPAEWYVGSTVFVDEALRPFQRIDPAREMTARPGLRLLDALVLQEPWFPPHGWCYTVDLLRRVGGYDARFMIEDYVLATRLARATEPVLVDDVIGFWRRNEGSMSHVRAEQMHLDVAAVATELLGDAPEAASRQVLKALAHAAAAARLAGAEDRAARYEASAVEFAREAAAAHPALARIA
jgi:glycosyltransferase involved in cell wall biosynthesis